MRNLLKITITSKSNLYGRLLIVFILMFATHILSSESAYLLNDPTIGPKIGGVVVSALYFIMLVYFIRIMTILNQPSVIIKYLWFYTFVAFFVIVYISNPFLDLWNEQTKSLIFTFCHINNLAVEAFFVYVILKDIFLSKETQPDHIWGAVDVYFLIILGFAEIYEIITLLRPGLLGEMYEMGWPNFTQCIIFSLSMITGNELNYPDAASLLTKIGSLENLVGTLFLVAVLGRLLSHPLKKLANM